MQHIAEGIEGDVDLPAFVGMSRLFLNTPTLECLHRYVIVAISLAGDHQEVLEVLESFAPVLNGFRSEATVLAFFEAVFQKLLNGEQCDGLARVFVVWIESADRLPISVMLDRLIAFDFSECADWMPLIVSKLLMKVSDQHAIKSFLFKIFDDTVPPRHSHWLIQVAFKAMHSEKGKLDDIGTALLELVRNDHEALNATCRLLAAIQYEDDFFRLSDTFGHRQPFRVVGARGTSIQSLACTRATPRVGSTPTSQRSSISRSHHSI
jgi:hypothetical protein